MNQEQLTKLLIEASEAYYNGQPALMTDLEYDRLIEDLKKMEDESGIILENSPTINVGAVVDSLKKVKHEYPTLSLNKTKYKDREDMYKWLSTVNNEAVVSLKLDGLTVVATYENGKLKSAVTRGNGIEGSDITHNAKYFKGLPRTISYKDKLIVRGECTMTTKEFNRINELVGDLYENPRNLASATIQMLDANESRKREIEYTVFDVISDIKDFDKELDFVKELGFDVVDYEIVNDKNILDIIEKWKEKALNIDTPTDGLVFTARDTELYKELGNTGHHPRGAMALKWTDETKTTTIRDIEWSVGRTGVITPVAIFDSVRLGLGSNITRASLHNLTIMKKLGVRKNSKTEVFLANMIIPQIASVKDTDESVDIELPKICPSCGEKLTIKTNNNIETLHCLNKDCPKQNISNILNSFSKDALFVKGLGESQIEDILEQGIATTDLSTFYNLPDNLPEELKAIDGWGDKKWSNIKKSIEESRNATIERLLIALNIPLMGHDLSKKVSKLLGYNIDSLKAILNNRSELEVFKDTMLQTEGIGDIKANLFYEWVKEADEEKVMKLINELKFEKVEINNDSSLEGVTFVITGNVYEYKNRAEFKKSVEARGGKVAGSISKKTDYLIINDLESTTSKANKARELNIPLISETDFIERFGK